MNSLLPALKISRDQASRNFRLGVANGIFYITAETAMDPTLVMVAFLSRLTDSPLLLGMVLPIRDGAWMLPQLWVSGWLQSVPHKLTVYRNISYIRVLMWIVVALTMNLVSDPALLLVLFFTAFSISSIASGFSGLPFLEVVGKTIPADRRGEFFAWRFGLAGIGSILASAFVRWVLDPHSPFTFPYNYGTLSVVFLVLAVFSVIAFCSITEPVEEKVLPRQNFGFQLRRALCVTRENGRFRAFLSLQALAMLAGSATPFFAVYVQDELGGSPAMIGVYLAILTAANLASNLVFGRLSRRVGNSRVMTLAVAAGVSMSALVLLLTLLARPLQLNGALAGAWLLPVYVLLGIRGSGMGVTNNALLLDIAPAEERSLYLGFSNTLLGLVLLSTGLSGGIVKLFGFQALIGFTLICHVLAMLLALKIAKNK